MLKKNVPSLLTEFPVNGFNSCFPHHRFQSQPPLQDEWASIIYCGEILHWSFLKTLVDFSSHKNLYLFNLFILILYICIYISIKIILFKKGLKLISFYHYQNSYNTWIIILKNHFSNNNLL